MDCFKREFINKNLSIKLFLINLFRKAMEKILPNLRLLTLSAAEVDGLKLIDFLTVEERKIVHQHASFKNQLENMERVNNFPQTLCTLTSVREPLKSPELLQLFTDEEILSIDVIQPDPSLHYYISQSSKNMISIKNVVTMTPKEDIYITGLTGLGKFPANESEVRVCQPNAKKSKLDDYSVAVYFEDKKVLCDMEINDSVWKVVAVKPIFIPKDCCAKSLTVMLESTIDQFFVKAVKRSSNYLPTYNNGNFKSVTINRRTFREKLDEYAGKYKDKSRFDYMFVKSLSFVLKK